jgi:hypothetical protein
MKIILIGANGTIGELVQTAMAGAGHEIVKVGRKSGDFQVDIESRESIRQLYQAVGSFDAVAVAAGEVVFAPLSQLTAENWQFSLGSKLMGQISLVQEAMPFINESGSFTLVSGVLNDETDLRQRRGCSRLGCAGRFRSGCRRRTSQGIADQCGESDDPEGIRSSIWSVLSRRNSPSKAGEWHRPTNARFWGCKPAASTKSIELAQCLFDDRPATSQEPGLAKEATCFN